MGEPTLYIIDDCSASTALTKKKDMLSMPAFSGSMQSNLSGSSLKIQLWPEGLMQADALDCLFHCKDRDSFEDCLGENNVISSRERALVRQQLAETKHAKLLLKTDQPVCYTVC